MEKPSLASLPQGVIEATQRHGQISAIATKQLDQWKIYARRWVVFPEMRETDDNHALGQGIQQLHLVCAGLRDHAEQSMPFGPCGTSILCIFNGGSFLGTDVETLESFVIAHLRNVHRKMEDVVYNG
jgi:hypothetical protein